MFVPHSYKSIFLIGRLLSSKWRLGGADSAVNLWLPRSPCLLSLCQGYRKENKDVPWGNGQLLGSSTIGTHHFDSHSIVWNIITWSHLVANSTGKYFGRIQINLVNSYSVFAMESPWSFLSSWVPDLSVSGSMVCVLWWMVCVPSYILLLSLKDNMTKRNHWV